MYILKEEEDDDQIRLLFSPTNPLTTTYIQNGNISEKFLIPILSSSSSSFFIYYYYLVYNVSKEWYIERRYQK